MQYGCGVIETAKIIDFTKYQNRPRNKKSTRKQGAHNVCFKPTSPETKPVA